MSAVWPRAWTFKGRSLIVLRWAFVLNKQKTSLIYIFIIQWLTPAAELSKPWKRYAWSPKRLTEPKMGRPPQGLEAGLFFNSAADFTILVGQDAKGRCGAEAWPLETYRQPCCMLSMRILEILRILGGRGWPGC